MGRRTLQTSLGLCVAIGVGTCGRAALAQTAPGGVQPRGGAASSGASTTGALGSASPAIQGPQTSADPVIRRNGGSLARALMKDPTDRASPTGPAVNYMAVAPQQPKSVKKHDLVQIIVNEQSAFSSAGTTDLKHTSDLDVLISSYLQFRLNNLSVSSPTQTNPLEAKMSGAHDFNGQASLNRSDSLTARITAEVVDVKPNGNLVLKATKKIKTDEEEQQFVLTGICRVQDVTADDTVLSNQLYGLELTKTHVGAVRDTTERGFLPRLLDSLNPF